MLVQIIASCTCVAILGFWTFFLVHQDNKKAKEAQDGVSKQS